MGNSKSKSLRDKGSGGLVIADRQHSADILSTFQDGSFPANNNRYVACDLLAEKGISSVIWFEDLLSLYGSDTQVWDLNLLVRDPHVAANTLYDAGYKKTPADFKFEYDPEFSKQSIRIAHSHSITGVVLLPAQDWYYDLNEDAHSFLPPLSKFLDSLIEFWLNISSRDYLDRVQFALYIGCLINYCYYLKDANGEPVNDPAYAKHLKPEHREVHYDIVAMYPHKESFTTTNRHQYHARRSWEIREGIFTPKPHKKGVFKTSLTTLSEQEK